MFRRLFRRFFRSVNPHPAPDKETAVGFYWKPDKQIQDFELESIKSDVSKGVYVGFPTDNAEMRYDVYFSDDEIVFEPLFISEKFANGIATLTEIKDGTKLERIQGFFNYTNTCLNYIFHTVPGKVLLKTLLGKDKIGIIISPGACNQYQSGDDAQCSVADTIIKDKFTEEGQAALMEALTKAAGQQLNNDEKFEWLANKINEMPLYSLFVAKDNYQKDFLVVNSDKVTKEQLKQWFQNGKNCDFAKEEKKREEVKILEFVKIAVIVALYEHSETGNGSGTSISFHVKKEESNITRPPAVGLAHELVHAFYNAQGKQPGVIFGEYSTTLTELLCVGLGPFANYDISENKIRDKWPPTTNIQQEDNWNNKRVNPRDPYEPVPSGETVAKMREKYHAI